MSIIKSKILNFIILSLFVLGVFLPTSINEQILPLLEIVNWSIFILLCTLVILLQQKVNYLSFFLGTGIILTLVLATIISPFQRYAYGAMLPFLGYIVLICIPWKEIGIFSISTAKQVLSLVSIILLIISFFIITKAYDISPFIKNIYSAFYQDLLTIMLDWGRKPVLTFASHSIAGFYYFIFFLLNYKTYRVSKEKKFLFISYLFIFSSLFLRSVTAYTYTAFCVLYILVSNYKRPVVLYKFFLITGVLTITLALAFKDTFTDLPLTDLISTFSEEGHGVMGRYSSNSTLMPMVKYIAENPLRPVGITNNDDFFFGDSGLLIFWLRGSFLLVVLFYASFYFFLQNNVCSKKDTILIFLSYFLFELGFINLGYFRTVYTLPFIIIYLNTLYSYNDKSSNIYRK